jgi:ubiquinone/menaquinone biosynthesis C-methylase UbiE
MERALQKILETVKSMKHELNQNSVILDFGCGNGNSVYQLRKYGFSALGCDFQFKSGDHVEELENSQYIRIIQKSPYRLPFEDDSFDLVFSMQVFEHVQDYQSTLAEIHRVLKPGGASLHIFPSRYRVIESHVFVPFASLFQQYWWLWLWAKLGIRTQYQTQMSAQEVAISNQQYLHHNTNYYNKKQIKDFVCEYFDDCRFCELEAAKYSRLGNYYGVVKNIPFLSDILSTFQTRVIYFQKTNNVLQNSS